MECPLPEVVLEHVCGQIRDTILRESFRKVPRIDQVLCDAEHFFGGLDAVGRQHALNLRACVVHEGDGEERTRGAV